MKRLSEQNHYDILEVAYDASWREIRQAYELARKTYGGDSPASHPLFTDEERSAIFARIEEAYRTLSDPTVKRKYDEALADIIPCPATAHPPAPADSLFPAAVGIVRDLPGDPPEGAITGDGLRQIRLKQGRSISEIAERTRINPDYIGFIEEEKMASLPHEVYLRSYVGQYATALNLNPKRVVDAYLARYRQWQKPPA